MSSSIRKLRRSLKLILKNNYSSYLFSQYSKEFTQKEIQSLLDKIDTTSIAANRLEEYKKNIESRKNS